jgi:hypothetical protein
VTEEKIKMVTAILLTKKELFAYKLLGIVYSHENNEIFKFQFSALFKSARPGNDPLCHSERSRTLCGEVEESVLFTLF